VQVSVLPKHVNIEISLIASKEWKEDKP
jgi:hypothetical protein